MNYSDRFFEFPVRIYDGFELRKAVEREEKALENSLETAEPIESDWVVGIAAILPENILGYSETFSKVKEVEDVVKNGFDLLLVETRNQGDVICTWSREKFKKKLDEFMAKYEKARNEDAWQNYKNNPSATVAYFIQPPIEQSPKTE